MRGDLAAGGSNVTLDWGYKNGGPTADKKNNNTDDKSREREKRGERERERERERGNKPIKPNCGF